MPSAIYDLHFSGNMLITTSTIGSVSLFQVMDTNRKYEDPFWCDVDTPKTWWHGENKPEYDSNGLSQEDELVPVGPLPADGVSLKHIKTAHLFPAEVLVISLAWHPKFSNVFAVSLSNGQVAVCTVYTSKEQLGASIEEVQILKLPLTTPLHMDNAYCIAWGQCFEQVRDGVVWHITHLVSGGDDSRLRYTQVGLNDSGGFWDYPAMEILVSEYGVTSLVHVSSKGYHDSIWDMFLVGGYDNIVRLVTVGSLTLPGKTGKIDNPEGNVKPLSSNMGGSIHKLAIMDHRVYDTELWFRRDTWFVLATCAQIGARILRVTAVTDDTAVIADTAGWPLNDSARWSLGVAARFQEHIGLNYASGFLPRQRIKDPALKKFLETDDMALCVSTSFEDQLMCVWKCTLEEDERFRA